MGGSGTAGALRVQDASGVQFFADAGVHNYKLWLDVVTNTKNGDTTVALLPNYYVVGLRLLLGRS